MDDHTYLFAFEVPAASRTAGREYLYSVLERAGIAGSWWHADPDHADNHDNDEAIFVRPGHWAEAGGALYLAGHADEAALRVGEHPQAHTIRTGADGHVMAYECGRCGETAEDIAALAIVPCTDLTLADHSHYWTFDFGSEPDVVGCAGADCRMQIVEDGGDWLPLTGYQYDVLDQNGTPIHRGLSWAIAVHEQSQYGPMASVYDHDSRKLQIVGTMPEDH